MKLSIVTTLYKSSSYVNEFYERISAEASKITDDYEIIFVDDGSPDDSLHKAVELHRHNRKVVVIELSRNFGHHKAIMTGLSYAKGEYVFLIDCDLEEEPELLGKFWGTLQLEKDVDVIIGKQSRRRSTSLFSDLSGKLFYKFFNHLSDTRVPTDEVMARLMKKNFVDALLKYQERNLFFPGILNHIGFKLQYVKAEKIHRNISSYTLFKKLIMGFDAIISFSIKPLVYLLWSGVIIFTLSFSTILYLVVKKYLYPDIEVGWTSLIASIWAIGGMVMLGIGILGIYMGKILSETKQRPATIIRNIYKDMK